MEFLVKLSQWSCEPAKRHELMLVSDTLGVTMLVDCINHRKMDPRATEWTVQGPFHGTRACKQSTHYRHVLATPGALQTRSADTLVVVPPLRYRVPERREYLP